MQSQTTDMKARGLLVEASQMKSIMQHTVCEERGMKLRSQNTTLLSAANYSIPVED
jgi:hypothetical protein